MRISKDQYSRLKEDQIQGRYVVNEQIISFLTDKSPLFKVETIGQSVQNRPIKCVTIGTGNKKILMWSQMHGNESTTTKAVLDLMNLLDSKEDFANEILANCTLKILPILNPDGAYAYTRVNANQVDLNRDAQHLSQPESKVLRSVYDDFNPDFCFNLHDQRTIFNVGTSSKPATVSFLAPAYDIERNVNKTRLIAMQLIAAMNETLQSLIPGQIGRYDDGFNANCVGDSFQMLNTPTLLFEAGHAQHDYEREITREYIFYALVKAIDTISKDTIESYEQKAYLNIPENGKLFFDVLFKNVATENSSDKKDVGVLYKEVLQDGKISFIPNITQEGNLDGFYGHENYDCQRIKDISNLKNSPLGQLVNI